MNERIKFLDLIRSNIEEYGYHITIVSNGAEPRYAYSIGLSDKLGFELILAGGILYMKDDLYIIFKSIVGELLKKGDVGELKVLVDDLGSFSLKKAHDSWNKLTMLGVFDYYNTEKITAFQINPDIEHFTLDVPNMTEAWDATKEPVWRWLSEEWTLPIPKQSSATTNLDALRGSLITEVMRWEEDYWEIFSGAGPDIPKEEVRVVPLGTLLGIDESIYSSINLDIGKGIWRDSSNLDWKKWG